MMHMFDSEIAKQYGVNCAILLNHIAFWIEKNRANSVNFYDEDYWTYNSARAFSELFPYLTQRQISTALQKLKDEKLIKTGNYNKSTYDRTLWYGLTEKGKSILHLCEMDYTQKSNGLPGNVEPIPDINTDRNADSKPYKEIVDYLNEKAGKRYRASSKKIRSLIDARMNEGFMLEDFRAVIDIKCSHWLRDAKMNEYLRPSTLFGTKFEEYLNSGGRKDGGHNGSTQSNYRAMAEKVGTYL